ncbi:hypothetical protein ACS0TY_011255 [Phlomoides rotata]
MVKSRPGIELDWDSIGISLSQRNYVLDILSDPGLQGCKHASTHLPLGLHLASNDGDPLSNPDQYRSLIRMLLYLNMSRPNVTYDVQQLSQFVGAPRTSHWDVVVHVLRYLKRSIFLGLFFPSSGYLTLESYSYTG